MVSNEIRKNNIVFKVIINSFLGSVIEVFCLTWDESLKYRTTFTGIVSKEILVLICNLEHGFPCCQEMVRAYWENMTLSGKFKEAVKPYSGQVPTMYGKLRGKPFLSDRDCRE